LARQDHRPGRTGSPQQRSDRRIDHFQIAASIGQTAVRIRAELKALEREQRIYQAANLWKLTDTSPQPL